VTQEQPSRRPQLDTSVASIARIYDYWLGGKDNFAVDREAAEAMIQNYPDIVTGVRKNRAFLGRAVHHLAAEAGIRQFLDIGTGLPSSNNTHEVAQQAAPESRIVYVDNDPIVLSHAQALLTSTRAGACSYIDADLRDAATILKGAASTLDFSEPIGVCLIMILQFLPDEDDPWQIVRTLMDAVPPGSYLTVAHPASDVDLEIAPAFRQLNTRMGPTQVVARSHEQVARFFARLDLVDPGLVQLHRWRPGPGADTTRALAAYGAVARKP
jgi:hypothetical protein